MEILIQKLEGKHFCKENHININRTGFRLTQSLCRVNRVVLGGSPNIQDGEEN